MTQVRPGTAFCDCLYLPDGRLAFLYGSPGKVTCEIDGQIDWIQSLPASAGLPMYLRCGIDARGLKALVLGGSDNNVYRVRQSGWEPLVVGSGQNCVAIDTNGDEYVMLSGTLYTKNGEPFPYPHSDGTSQGFRDVVNGEIRWADEWFVRDVNGIRLAQPVVRQTAIAGQLDNDNSDRVVASLHGTPLLAIGDCGHCFDPRLTEQNGKYAVCARTERGAALSIAPWPAFAVTAPPVVVPPPDVTPPEPEPAMPENLLPLVRQVFERRLGHLDRPANNDECAGVMNEVAWIKRDEGWGLSAKPGGNNAAQPGTGIRVAYDILQHKPSDSLWDALGPSENPKPLWGEAHPHNDPNRPWVAPVAPEGGDGPDPGDEDDPPVVVPPVVVPPAIPDTGPVVPIPGCQCADLRKDIEALGELIVGLGMGLELIGTVLHEVKARQDRPYEGSVRLLGALKLEPK